MAAGYLRVAVVGGGIAGALLAWRLHQGWRQAVVQVFVGAADRPDASAASGGLVRGFEVDPGACALAAESMAELGRNATLREWARYRNAGSLYLLPPGADPTASLLTVDSLLPGSATVLSTAQLARRFPLHGLPEGTIGIAERHAGYLSPDSLRAAVLAELAARGVTIRRLDVAGVTTAPALRLSDGTRLRYDVVVVAAGAWTPRLLAASALPGQGMRGKQIQYTLVRGDAALEGLGPFVDDTSGLYGRPADGGGFLLGLPSRHWDVVPGAVSPDPELATEVLACAARRLGVPDLAPRRTVASSDCYHQPPGLAIRRCMPGSALFTFSGGSGGAAKSILAASRVAAHTLIRLHARNRVSA